MEYTRYKDKVQNIVKNTFRSHDYNVKYGFHQQNRIKLKNKKNSSEKDYQKYKKIIKQKHVSKIIKKGELQESYNK